VTITGKTTDGRFVYEADGDPNAPALVFLHGVGGAARAWRGQLAAFARNWRTLAWDMPGYGGSRPLPDVSVASLAAALGDFLDALALRRPVLVGHSIGGMILQEFVAARPGMARAIVLAQTSAAFGRSDGEWQRTFLADRLGPLDRGETVRDIAPRLVAGVVGEAPDTQGIAAAEACMAAVDPDTYRAMVRALMGFDRREALGRIGVPAMVLAGTRDPNAPAPMMRRMAHAIPGAYFVELEGCGHLANLERPDAFNAVLGDWLETLP
jgi:3-oxoadipate enol-lactonase